MMEKIPVNGKKLVKIDLQRKIVKIYKYKYIKTRLYYTK